MPADSLALVRAMLLNQTSAGNRVSQDLPASPVFPYITFERIGGGRSNNDIRRVEPRMQVNVWAQTRTDAYAVSRQVEEVFLPSMEQTLSAGRSIAKGFNGDVAVGATSVYVWDVVQEVGLTWLPDPDTQLPRYFAYYVLKHF